jgi:hypothetical protein
LGSGWARRFSSGRARDGLVIGVGGLAARHVGGDHQPDLLAHVVEGQHLVEEEQAGVGNAQFVLGQLGQPLDLADRIIGKEAHRPGGKRRQPLEPRRLVAAERPRSTAKMSPSIWTTFLPSVMVISRPRATIRLKGARPMKV